MSHWRRVDEGMMDGMRMMRSHVAVRYRRRMVEWKMMIMDGGSSLSSRDSVRTEGNYRVGEGVGVESLVGQERVDLHLGTGWDCQAEEQHQGGGEQQGLHPGLETGDFPPPLWSLHCLTED